MLFGERIEMLEENLSEKLSTKMVQVDLPVIPDYEYFVKIKDFERLVWFITLFSLILFVVALIL